MNRFSKYFCWLLLAFLWPQLSAAYQINLVDGTSLSNDFVVGPGKNELSLDPGQNQIREISILNRSNQDLTFTVRVEDFTSSDPNQATIKFTGDQANPNPATKWLIPEISKFTLKSKEKMTLPIMVKISEVATPGGLYGAVLVSAQPDSTASGNQVKTTASLASLFFVRVKGNVNEVGQLINFSSSKYWYEKGPITLSYSFKNTGNIYLNPHGDITITDWSGKQIYQQPILPYFVMPGVLRQQQETWQSPVGWGFYRATINLSRGYGNYIDRRSANLVLLPAWSLYVGALLLVILFVWLIKLILRARKR